MSIPNASTSSEGVAVRHAYAAHAVLGIALILIATSAWFGVITS
ncbi:hypothetical protein [Nocardia sp. NPDC051463]